MTVEIAGLKINDELYKLVDKEIAGGTGVTANQFFEGLAKLVRDHAGENEALLIERNKMQEKIDQWLKKESDGGRKAIDPVKYEKFLQEIEYIVRPGWTNFEVKTENVDDEIAKINGPQLVCPMFIGDNQKENARYPLNAANARWGSLYDAVYGKPGDANVISEADGKGFAGIPYNSAGDQYNPARGQAVVDYTNKFLDKAIPLAGMRKYADVKKLTLKNGELRAILQDGKEVGLKNPEKFVGFLGDKDNPGTLLLKNNGLHIQLKLTPETDIEKAVAEHNKPAICNVVLESAVTTIQDLEDATAAVDAADKTLAYRNLNGLMKGNLQAENVEKEPGGIRTLHPDLHFMGKDGKDLQLPGRSLMLVRNVGMHMYTDAVTTKDGKAIPEAFLDGMITALTAKHDLAKTADDQCRNSRTGSVYIVAPKMHSPKEVDFKVRLFKEIEELVGLKDKTLKLGIMDEEQRMSVNLKEALRAAKDRAIFINTGFLDRTGSLIHTAMNAGLMETQQGIKESPWLGKYELSNVWIGLTTFLHTCGQIGKGMWTRCKDMLGMVDNKQAHPEAGADTAWVPSNHAATLHAMHYHFVNVEEKQKSLLNDYASGREKPPSEKSDILQVPLLKPETKAFLEKNNGAEKKKLLDAYTQSILGYVVRWVDQGVGCSAVPNYEGVALMEDRATLRIGSQLLANWLKYNFISKEELIASFKEMAAKVDIQNSADHKKGSYTNIVGNYNGPAFQAALRLVLEGEKTKDGYVEDILHAARRGVKKMALFAEEMATG